MAKKRIIEISVNDEYVVGSGVVIGAAGADESVILQVEFNEIWDGLSIYATFRDAKGETPTVKMLMPSMLVVGELRKYQITVPAAATAHEGKMSLVFSGFAVSESYLYAFDGEIPQKLVYRDAVINTANAYFRVLPSDFSALDVEDQEEATLLEQVLAEMNDFGEEIVQLKEDMATYKAELDTQIDEFEKKVDEFASDITAYKETVNEKITGFEDKITGFEDKITGFEDKIAGFETDIDSYKEKVDRFVENEEARDDEMNEALDRIIGIQEILMGPREITFTIKVRSDPLAYKALEGMTWGEWCNSKYNTLGLQVEPDGIYHYDEDTALSTSLHDLDLGSMVVESDLVIANGSYVLF